jgi:rare lipoprotein A
LRYLTPICLALLLVACSTTEEPSPPGPIGTYKLGKPYQIDGKWYYPRYDPSYDKVGIASWYGAEFHGLTTANGEIFDKERVSAAHPTLPLPSLVRVTNLENGRSTVLRVNDRGPFVDDRLIDLSEAAARELGFRERGLARVRVQFVQIADAHGVPPTPSPQPAAPRPPVIETPRIALAAASRPASRPTAPLAPTPAGPPAAKVAALALAPVPAPSPAKVAAIAPASVPAPPATCGGSAWVVQVGAFADAPSARAVVAQTAHLERVRLEPAFANGVAVARVRLGPLPTAPQAQALLERVHALGHPGAFVTCAAPLPGPVGVS